MTDEELAAAVEALLKDWPPLTDEEVARLIVLLHTQIDAPAE